MMITDKDVCCDNPKCGAVIKLRNTSKRGWLVAAIHKMSREYSAEGGGVFYACTKECMAEVVMTKIS